MNPDRYSEPVDEARTHKRPSKPIPMDMLLERGGPYELLPEDLRDALHWAREYADDPERELKARERVRAVWLEGHPQAPWLGDS